MSQWTHISGVVRVDSMPVSIFPQDTKRIVEEIFYESLPSGSEGPAKVIIHEPPNPYNSISWGVVTIWGDLRDRGIEEVDGIKSWFEIRLAMMKVNSLMVRQASLVVDVEFNTTFIGIDKGDYDVDWLEVPYDQ